MLFVLDCIRDISISSLFDFSKLRLSSSSNSKVTEDEGSTDLKDWVRSYLSDSQPRTRCKDSTQYLHSRAITGFGPILFFTFINGVPKHSLHLNADDLQIYYCLLFFTDLNAIFEFKH